MLDPSKKSVEENWTQFKTMLFDTIKKHIPQRTIIRKSISHGLVYALNALFVKRSDVKMLPDTAVVNKTGANLKIFKKWYKTKCEKLNKTTSITF